MFKILVLDKKDGIHYAIKYLLHRYELLFCHNAKDALDTLNKDSIDMILVNMPLENGTYSLRDFLKEWSGRKKTVIIADMLNNDITADARKLGALFCIDKLDVPRLPEIVNRCLNQAETKILNLV